MITDLASLEIAASLARELDEVAPRYRVWVLEELAARPLIDMPLEVLADMETSEVSIFAVCAQQGELRSRMQMTDVVNRRKMRHAHMVNIEKRIMLEGMRADFQEVDRISQQVWELASRATEIRATTEPRAPTSRPPARRTKVAEDQRDHQPQQVGQPARRRDLHVAMERRGPLCGGWRGGRLSLRQVRRPARNAAHH
ncbi:MAG: hypothetical protein U5J83_14345 [Bryobacterales bacterium]|nr:hypothetical protein [Bryobacterales bacterium]